MTKWVYTFGDCKAEGESGMKNLLGAAQAAGLSPDDLARMGGQAMPGGLPGLGGPSLPPGLGGLPGLGGKKK